MSRPRGRFGPLAWLTWLMLAGTLAAALYGAAILLSGPLLGTADAAGRADMMVVLGGDGPARADRASALWRAGAAPLVLITGRGDCGSIADRMATEGVSRAAMTLECRSANTWQNAAFSGPLLARKGVHTVLLVTNWFHARRALASFQAQCPHLSFAVDSVAAPPFTEIAMGPYGPAVLGEYPKTVVYMLRRWLAGFGVEQAQAAGGEGGQWTHC